MFKNSRDITQNRERISSEIMKICLKDEKINDEELVDRLKKTGDKNYFEPLVERYKNPVMKIAYRMTGEYDAGLEIAQETFMKAWTYINSFKTDMKFSSWIFKIASNIAKDHCAKRKKSVEMEEPLMDNNVYGDQSEWKNKLEGGLYVQFLLDKVREPYKTAVILRFMKDLSYEDIAGIMDTTVEQVKNYLFRGKKYLLELAKEAESYGT